MNILITGCAGFIGYHLANNITLKNINVYGIDNLNSYYSTKLKNLRLSILKKKKNFKFIKADISNFKQLDKVFGKYKIDLVINLASKSGVRYSLEKPKDYIETNILGFFNLLELSRKYKLKKIIYASSSSVYGDKKIYPVKETEKIQPKNVYSLSKKNNEEIAEIYYKQYGISSIGLRFFTVYGEWGRPDMLMLKYMLSKYKNIKFSLNNKGNHYRDFTYIDDVTGVLKKLINKKINGSKIYNVCSNKPKKISKILKTLDKLYGKPKMNIKINSQLRFIRDMVRI